MSILQLKEWMGHADIDTTMQYLHYAPRAGDADLVAEAFASETVGTAAQGLRSRGGASLNVRPAS